MGRCFDEGRLLQRVQHLQLGLDALDVGTALKLQGDAAFGCSA